MNFKFTILNFKLNSTQGIFKINSFYRSLRILNLKPKIIISFLFLIIVYQLSAIACFAQQNTITVTPQLVQIDLSRNLAEAEYTYTNNTPQTIELSLSMQDIKELEERGIPGLIDPNETKTYKYGLSSWATFSNKNLVIGSHESKKVTIFIDKKRLTVGGHYASVLAEVKQLTNNSKTIKLRGILSSLLFVRSGTENEVEEANIIEINPVRDWFHLPNSLTFRFQNSGNVDVTPYGLLKIYDPFGREVAKEIVNEDSLITLPDSIRRYTININNYQSITPPGFYKAQLSIHYGKKNIKTQKEIVFFTTGSMTLLGVVAALLVCLGAYFVFKKFSAKKNE